MDTPWEDMTEKQKIFKVWTLIETLVVLSAIATNVVYVLLRNIPCLRDSIAKYLPDFETSDDPNQDFLNCESKQLLISVLNQSIAPILVYYILDAYLGDDALSEG